LFWDNGGYLWFVFGVAKDVKDGGNFLVGYVGPVFHSETDLL